MFNTINQKSNLQQNSKNLSKSTLQKIGISLVSTKIINIHPKIKSKHQTINNNTRQVRNKNILNKQTKAERVQLRSLSVERIKRKKQKMMKKSQCRASEQIRDGLQQNINQLELQYDQLKLKRSLMTQRQSEKSTGKPRFSDLQANSENKANFKNNSKLFMNKCVPKSKINLHQLAKTSGLRKQNENTYNMKNLQKSNQFQNISNISSNISQNGSNIFVKQRNKSTKSISSYSILQASCISQTIINSSLNNLQVIPIGLNVSLAQKNKMSNAKTLNNNDNNKREEDTIKSIQKSIKYPKKGILVMSSNKKRNDLSLSSSVISLEGIKLTNKDFSQNRVKDNYQYTSNRINLFGASSNLKQNQQVILQ